jgi:chromosome segregation protein
MYLAKLELQGFKTFAQKTTLVFPGPKDETHPVTSIVGPNGSGKSNLADAIRWALGEQSLKLLRGKRSEDVIFSGSEGRGRAGFAEVNLTFNNEDKSMPVDFAEVVVTRRLYRDGESEYLLNGASSRLSDIRLLLAQANVGQQSYSVIGQGMVDHILVSTPEERKAFFDDATGVKPLQLKRHEAMLKLKRTHENLTEVEMLLREIEPRLRSLKRQVSRLEKRSQVETGLHDLQARYYGTLWWTLQDQLLAVRGQNKTIEEQIAQASGDMRALENRVAGMEKEERAAEGTDAGLLALQKQYHDAQKKRSRLRDEEFEVQRQTELAKVRAQANWAPLPLSKILEEIQSVVEGLKGLKGLKGLEELHAQIERLHDRSSKLLGRLQRPTPEDFKPDPAMTARLESLKAERAMVDDELKRLESEIEAYAKQERQQRTELFDLQRDLREWQRKLHLLENQRHGVQIELARFEEREQNLAREIDQEMKELTLSVKTNRPSEPADTDALYPEIQRLRYQLELIGGIDPEIVKEFKETNARFTFLDAQVEDLKGAMRATEKIIDELDEKIHKQSEKAFRDINREFQRFFKILFGGGSCELIKLTREEMKADEEETDVALERPMAETAETEREHEEAEVKEKTGFTEREDRVVGVDIHATPPGKKLKALNLLSGGERALTSIALVSAIMATNPAPFVVLDEVDAALDEANTLRFAAILEELAKLTQFIVVTHNRATMEKADVLYGVTMGDDGVSNLLSVKLEDIAANGTARR